MIRAAIVMLAACSSSAPSPPAATHTTAPPAELRWTNADGSLIAVMHGNSIDGACGPIATLDGTTVVLPDQKVTYDALAFKAGVLVLPGMVFELHVARTGEVTQHYTSGAAADQPAGKVTGLVDDASRDRFRAMVTAVTLRRTPDIELDLPLDPPKMLYRYRFEQLVNAKGDPVLVMDADRIVKSVTVTHTPTGFDVVLDGVDKHVGGNFRATKFAVIEKDGTLSFGDKPFAKLVNRHACAFDDDRAAHLIEQLFWTHDGLERLRDAGLPEPELPPPPPPPKPRH